MSCMVRFFLFALAGASRAWATWNHWPLVSIQWANYRASPEKVCFYFWGYTETGPMLTKEAVGPVSYKESITSTTDLSSLVGFGEELGENIRIFINYGYAATNASSCPQDPVLVEMPGINETSRSAWLSTASWMAADWMPTLALYSNGFLAQMDGPWKQGLAVQAEFGAPLHCKPEDDSVFPTLFDWAFFVYAANFPQFEDRSSWSTQPPLAQELVVGFNCVELDDPRGDGLSWVGEGTEQLNITLNLTEYVRSTCDFEGKAAKLTATVVGDGSAEFPYEYLVRMMPPSLFNCSWPWPVASTGAPTPAPTPAVDASAAGERFVGASALAAVAV